MIQDISGFSIDNMIPTKQYIESKFHEFNHLCFDGSLRPLPIRLCNARTFLGKISYKRTRKSDGSWDRHSFVLHISTKIDLPENVVEDTIIHEMIHYWIFSNRLEDSSSHGRLFRGKMQEINMRHGRNISVTHRFTEDEHNSDKELKLHLVCVSNLADGRTAITLAMRTNLWHLWDEIERIPMVKEFRWWLTMDTFFNRFPRSRTLKFYVVSAAEVHSHLADAKRLVRQEGKIKIQN